MFDRSLVCFQLCDNDLINRFDTHSLLFACKDIHHILTVLSVGSLITWPAHQNISILS